MDDDGSRRLKSKAFGCGCRKPILCVGDEMLPVTSNIRERKCIWALTSVIQRNYRRYMRNALHQGTFPWTHACAVCWTEPVFSSGQPWPNTFGSNQLAKKQLSHIAICGSVCEHQPPKKPKDCPYISDLQSCGVWLHYNTPAETMLSCEIPPGDASSNPPRWFTCDPHHCTSSVSPKHGGGVKWIGKKPHRRRGCMHSYSNSARLWCSELNPICSRRINSGGGGGFIFSQDLFAGNDFGFSTSSSLSLDSLFPLLPPAVPAPPPSPLCVLSCRFCAGSPRSIAANERRLYEGVSRFPLAGASSSNVK